MADNQPSDGPDGVDHHMSSAGVGWTAVGYLIAGMAVWGLIGWLVDSWLHLGGIATAIGIVLGVAGGVVLIVRKIAIPAGQDGFAGSDGRAGPAGREPFAGREEDGERRQ